jgi:hypothetical protein
MLPRIPAESAHDYFRPRSPYQQKKKVGVAIFGFKTNQGRFAPVDSSICLSLL